MFKKILKCTLPAVAAVAVVSCSKSEVDGFGGVDGGSTPNLVTITADESRSGIDLTGGFSWKSGDALGVSNSANANSKFSAVDASSESVLTDADSYTASAAFSGTLVPTADAEYAYIVYPYSAEGSFAGGSYTFTLAEQQRQLYTNANAYKMESVADYAYMYGRSTTALESGATTMGAEMSHLMNFLHIDLSYDANIEGIDNGTQIRSVKVTCATPELFQFATSATVNFSQDGEPTFTLGEGRCNEISTDFLANTKPYVQVTKTNDVTIRFTTFPQTIPVGTEFTIEIQTVVADADDSTQYTDSDLLSFTKTFTKDLVGEAGYYYGLVNLASNAIPTIELDGTSSLQTLISNAGMTASTIEKLAITGDYPLTTDDFSYISTTLIKSGALTYLDISGTQTASIPDSAFNQSSSKMTTYILGDVVKEVGYQAFANNKYLTYIDMSGVETFKASGTASSTFKNCYLLESIELPSLTTIEGSGAFQYCSALNSVVFGEGQLTFTNSNASTFQTTSTPFTITTNSPYLPAFSSTGTFAMTDIDVTIRYPEEYESVHKDKWTKTGAASVTYESFTNE